MSHQNDQQKIYQEWTDKQAAIGRQAVPGTTAVNREIRLPSEIEVTITDGPDPNAPIPDKSIKILGHVDMSASGKFKTIETGQAIRICIDADCPKCGWPERWYDGERFGCNKCEYRSAERNR